MKPCVGLRSYLNHYSRLPVSSHFGHDKSLEIKPYAALPDNERPILLYAGDGVSDLSAAAETNLLFAKEGKGTPESTQEYHICSVGN